MFDFNTAVQTALSPVFTIPVIVILIFAIAAQARRMKYRLREQAKRLGKMTGVLLAAVTAGLKSETEREVGRAIEFTYNTLKNIGFDKLAKGDVTFEGVMFGAEPFRRRQWRDHDPLDPPSPFDPLAPFSMDDLKEALRPKAEAAHPKDTLFVDSHGGVHDFEEPRKNTGDDEGAGLGGKGQRPYHKATDFDLSAAEARRPRD